MIKVTLQFKLSNILNKVKLENASQIKRGGGKYANLQTLYYDVIVCTYNLPIFIN